MRSSSRFGIAVLLGLTPLGLPGSAFAQQPMQLPGIYVESATISARPVRAAEPPASGREALNRWSLPKTSGWHSA